MRVCGRPALPCDLGVRDLAMLRLKVVEECVHGGKLAIPLAEQQPKIIDAEGGSRRGLMAGMDDYTLRVDSMHRLQEMLIGLDDAEQVESGFIARDPAGNTFMLSA